MNRRSFLGRALAGLAGVLGIVRPLTGTIRDVSGRDHTLVYAGGRWVDVSGDELGPCEVCGGSACVEVADLKIHAPTRDLNGSRYVYCSAEGVHHFCEAHRRPPAYSQGLCSEEDFRDSVALLEATA